MWWGSPDIGAESASPGSWATLVTVSQLCGHYYSVCQWSGHFLGGHLFCLYTSDLLAVMITEPTLQHCGTTQHRFSPTYLELDFFSEAFLLGNICWFCLLLNGSVQQWHLKSWSSHEEPGWGTLVSMWPFTWRRQIQQRGYLYDMCPCLVSMATRLLISKVLLDTSCSPWQLLLSTSSCS